MSRTEQADSRANASSGGADASRGPTVHASLVLRAFEGDPSKITNAIGLEPTRTGRKGEPRVTVTGRVTRQPNQDSFWSLRSTASASEGVETHIESLLAIVQPHAQQIRDLPGPMVKQIYCTIIPGESVPLITLSPSLSARLAELGVDVVVDVLSVEDRSA